MNWTQRFHEFDRQIPTNFFPNTHNGFWISSRVAFVRLHEIFNRIWHTMSCFFVIWRVFFSKTFKGMNIYIPDAWPIRKKNTPAAFVFIDGRRFKAINTTIDTSNLTTQIIFSIFFNSWTSPIMLPISLIWIYISLMVLLRGTVLCVPSQFLAK